MAIGGSRRSPLLLKTFMCILASLFAPLIKPWALIKPLIELSLNGAHCAVLQKYGVLEQT